MNWKLAIETNREALKRILAMLVALAGLTASDTRAATLPRHLHRFVLRLLRPTEAATRRLVIIAARGLEAKLPPSRIAKPKPNVKPALMRASGLGTGIVMRLGSLPASAQALAPKRSSALSLPLFDPVKRVGPRRRRVKPTAAPRIKFFDEPHIGLFVSPPAPAAPPSSPDDPLDAERLHRRLDAIGRALDDLPRQATRLARWQARRDAVLAQGGGNGDAQRENSAASGVQGKVRRLRLSPMRLGRPPGWRRRPDHDVYEVLNTLHGLAFWACQGADTS